jgi:polysaccharide chain length determinant protein (PEP-CTERM system associated)
MIENRELTMDDYFAILRRRWKVLLIPVILAPLVGFAVSFAFPPKYTSQSTVLVQEQKVPEGYVKPVVTEDLGQRITQLEQRALGQEQLRPMIMKLNLARGNSPDQINQVMDEITKNVSIQAVQAVIGGQTWGKSQVPGFNVAYTASSPLQAQQVCSELTNVMIRQNFNDIEEVSRNTTDFLSRQVDDQKRQLNDLDSKLADFKKKFIGQLPGDEDNNLKLLMAKNSQLEAETQALSRAQQDKSYAESVLAQQVAAWKSSQSSTDPVTLQKQLSDLQAQLITLKARYTDDYPEVVKAKNDIKEVQKKLDDINAAAAKPDTTTDTKAALSEPPEIQQLRAQVHQYENAITALTRDQQRVQQDIRSLEGKVALSPAVEEQYKQLTRDYDTAQKVYDDLLAKKSQSEMQTAMEREQQGEQMTVLRAADLPESPSFPDRLLFTGGGFAGGLAIGFSLVLWLEMRDKSVRTEQDVIAILGIPVLTQVPWVGTETAATNGNGKRPIPARLHDEKEHVVEV